MTSSPDLHDPDRVPTENGLNSAWWDLSLIVKPEQEDIVFWRLETFGSQGITSEAYDDQLMIHAYMPLSEVRLLDLAALSLKIRQDALVMGQPAPKLRWERMDAEDWSTSWKSHWQPQEVGDRLLICPAWLEPPDHPKRKLLRMDPGMAFGTGVHPTTQLCLEALEMRLDTTWGNSDPSVLKLADVGSGSGILSVAAALLGAGKIFAVDTDPLAVKAAAYNRDLNEISAEIVEVKQGSLEDISEMVDGLVCNILADTILDMIPEFKLVVKEQGWLILSGILVDQAKFVAETLEANDWIVSALWKRQEWCCLNVRTE